MKRIHPRHAVLLLLTILTLALAGCGTTYPLTARIDLQTGTQPSDLYPDHPEVTVICQDLRRHPAVIVYRFDDKPAVLLDSYTPPQEMISEKLEAALRQQGANPSAAAPVSIKLEIKHLRVTVKRPKMLYTAKARSQIALTVHRGTTTLTRNFQRDNSSESLRRPKVAYLETMLEKQLDDIARRILADEQIRNLIRHQPQEVAP